MYLYLPRGAKRRVEEGQRRVISKLRYGCELEGRRRASEDATPTSLLFRNKKKEGRRIIYQRCCCQKEKKKKKTKAKRHMPHLKEKKEGRKKK